MKWLETTKFGLRFIEKVRKTFFQIQNNPFSQSSQFFHRKFAVVMIMHFNFVQRSFADLRLRPSHFGKFAGFAFADLKNL